MGHALEDAIYTSKRSCLCELGAQSNAMQGPEIRTGFLKNPDQPTKLNAGKEITITTDYSYKGDDQTISMRYSRKPTRLAHASHALLCQLKPSCMGNRTFLMFGSAPHGSVCQQHVHTPGSNRPVLAVLKRLA